MTRTDMTHDLEELKRKAEEAFIWAGKKTMPEPIEIDPSTILSLIARLEAAEARVKVLEAELAKPTRVVVRKVPAPQISFED